MVFIAYEILKGEVAKEKQLHGYTNADLGKMTGYRPYTIAAFMSGAKESENVANALAAALKIER